MKHINRVQLLGHVGADAETRTTSSGDKVATFRLATTAEWRTEQGEKREATEWHTVTAWGQLAEWVGRVAVKGAPLLVEGKLVTEEWTDASQVKRRTTYVKAHDVNPLESKAATDARRAATHAS